MNTITKYIVLAVVGAAVLSAADLAAGENVPGIVNDDGRWSRDVDGKEMVCFYKSASQNGQGERARRKQIMAQASSTKPR